MRVSHRQAAGANSSDAGYEVSWTRSRLANAFGAITTVIAAILIASNLCPKVMVAGFSIFVAASLLWILAGYLDDKPSLIVQNAVLLVVNVVGIWRWLPKT